MQVVLCNGFFDDKLVHPDLKPGGETENIDDYQRSASILLVALMQTEDSKCK